MEIALLVAVGLAWLTALATFVALRRQGGSESLARGSKELAIADEPAAEADSLERRETEGAVELWWPAGGKLATISVATDRRAGAVLRSPWVRRSVGSVLKRAVPSPSRSARYRVSFPPDLLDTIREGGSVDVALAGGSLTTVGLGGTVAGPAAALAVGAAAVSMVHQQKLDRTLAIIEQRLDAVIDRMRDGDHGRLDAAEALLEQLDKRPSLTLPAQMRSELAIARYGADAVYFARRRFVDRLGEAIGDAQGQANDEEGSAKTWATGVLDAVGDTDDLRSELLVYLRALVVRARLATATAGVLAADGEVAFAGEMLDNTVEELRADFYSIYRRLRPLAKWAPQKAVPWRRREWERAHATVVEVFELMSSEVEPSLPSPERRSLELDVSTDASGDVSEVTIVDG